MDDARPESEDSLFLFRYWLYKPYAARGGNGAAERIIKGVERLEIRTTRSFSKIKEEESYE